MIICFSLVPFILKWGELVLFLPFFWRSRDGWYSRSPIFSQYFLQHILKGKLNRILTTAKYHASCVYGPKHCCGIYQLWWYEPNSLQATVKIFGCQSKTQIKQTKSLLGKYMTDSHSNFYPYDLATQMVIGNPLEKKSIKGKKAFFLWLKSRVNLTYALLSLASPGSSPRPNYNTKEEAHNQNK